MWAAMQILPWLSYSVSGLLNLGSCTLGTVKRQTVSKDSVAPCSQQEETFNLILCALPCRS